MNSTTEATAARARSVVLSGELEGDGIAANTLWPRTTIATAAVRNLLHAVLFLILSFVGIAGLYITLSADFVAVTQVLIYAGAIAVLMIFAVMLTPRASRDNAEGLLQTT